MVDERPIRRTIKLRHSASAERKQMQQNQTNGPNQTTTEGGSAVASGVTLPILGINILDVSDIEYVLLIPKGPNANKVKAALKKHRSRRI